MPEAQWLTSLVDEDAVIMDNCAFHHVGTYTVSLLHSVFDVEYYKI